MWVLVLLIPVLYVNQEMVLRLGAVTGVGHARLIFERFGKFWGAFSVVDLFLLNALTIVTEFIGVSLALDYLGLNKIAGVCIAAGLVIASVSTGSFRRFERFSMALVVGSLLLLPIYFLVHPSLGQVAHDLVVPQIPATDKPGDLMLLVIGLVGTTVAPWQLFFQQSYVIDKRITPRFLRYERIDLWLGIALCIVGAVAIIGFTAAAFAGRPEFGNFTDAGGIAFGLEKYAGKAAGVMFAIALIDAAMIGAAAVSLSTAYAIGDVFSANHSLHRPVQEARGFYAVYALLIAVAAGIVLTPNAPLGLITVAVQTLAGVLLPSATVFLLLLCNDKPVLGPWVNHRAANLFTGVVIAALVVLSMILTASVLFPDAMNSKRHPRHACWRRRRGAGLDGNHPRARREWRGAARQNRRSPSPTARAGACRRSNGCLPRGFRSAPRPGWARCASISSSPAASCWCASSRSRSMEDERGSGEGWRPPLETRQPQARAQAALRAIRKRQRAAIGRGELDDDRQAEPGTGARIRRGGGRARARPVSLRGRAPVRRRRCGRAGRRGRPTVPSRARR